MGQLTVSPGVPFRLLVTACPARNVFFKTRLSSNAGYYNGKEQVQQFERMQALQL